MSEEFQFDADELAELRAIFFEQAAEVLDHLNGLILTVERDPSDAEALRSIRRSVHTLKGDSTAFGYAELTELAHHYEDALDHLNSRAQSASRALIDLLLAGADALAALVAHYRGEGEMPDTRALVEGLSLLKAPPAAAQTEPARPALHEPAEDGCQPSQEGEKGFALLESPTLQAAAAGGGPPAAPDGGANAEAEHARSGEAPPHGERRQGEDRRQGDDRRRAGAPAPQGAATLRVESERIDAAMNLVGELIIQRSMMATVAAELEEARHGSDDLARRLAEALALNSRTLSELQESVMRMRLVAIDQVFKRFPRVVRDASVKLGKPLRIEIKGGHTEIDKSVVELISDPLIHLVRNACDHGVEPPAVRRAAGKPEEGVIRLCARRAGNQIEVEVSDDGAGIDAGRIAAKAVEKSLVTPQAVADWTDQQKLGLIFLPGFSTKESVSDMSGRGVGMDVVKTTVDSLGGSVAISSEPGAGSRFTIRLPLTMAIVRAMLFDSAGRRFALPLDLIREITRMGAGACATVARREVLRLRDRVLPLIRVDEALGLGATANERAPRPFVLVVEPGDGRDVGLVVDRLYGEQELVLKSIDDALTRSEMVAGASILGDGGVVLILDGQAVVARAQAAGAVAA